MNDENENEKKSAFERRWQGADGEKVGARWWQEDARANEGLDRRKLLKGFLIGGGVLAGGALLFSWANRDSDTVIENKDSLDVQKAEGWNVGADDRQLAYPGAQKIDVDGNRVDPEAMRRIADELAPKQDRHKPFYVPTLYQVLAQSDAHATKLRNELPAIINPPMEEAFRRGTAFVELFKSTSPTDTVPRDTVVVADLAGPEAVAFAAAVAEHFEPVFLFDNWPHPVGVVPSHDVLAATAYFRPVFQRAAEKRPADAPAVFVVDRRRLAPYSDETSQFDNRYMAKLPSPEALAPLGVKHVAYVTPQGTEELDDLNEEFVALDKASIDVKTVELSDFTPDPESGDRHVYYYGGHPMFVPIFWGHYGWYAPVRSYGPAPAHRTPPGARGARYRPRPRPTIFSGRTVGAGRGGVGRQKPSGFGRVSVASSRATGRVVGAPYGRSGSFGRGGSYGG